VSGQWEHNDGDSQWELIAYRWDASGFRRTRIVGAWITDEFIDRVANPERAAARLSSKLGSVPPPLEALLPPFGPDVVIYP
jgi:hypothetical protein